MVVGKTRAGAQIQGTAVRDPKAELEIFVEAVAFKEPRKLVGLQHVSAPQRGAPHHELDLVVPSIRRDEPERPTVAERRHPTRSERTCQVQDPADAPA